MRGRYQRLSLARSSLQCSTFVATLILSSWGETSSAKHFRSTFSVPGRRGIWGTTKSAKPGGKARLNEAMASQHVLLKTTKASLR
mmetsp:Transcript_30435/g.85406  ORF Transcript_30435/g.85406 Transcript_30435/m.85406 type:complete len:85 (-) Transcript_30435:1073-1327(-)